MSAPGLETAATLIFAMVVVLRRPAGFDRAQTDSYALATARPRNGFANSALWRFFVAPAGRLLRALDGDRSLAIEGGEELLQVLDLGEVVYHDVGISRVLDQEILMVRLRWIERREPIHARDDGPLEHLGLFQLGDVGLRDVPL